MTNEEQAIRRLIRTIHVSLEDIYESGRERCEDFALGQIYAYVECLEILQLSPKFRKMGLDYEIETQFPI